jgi:hypothetical protein
VAEAVNSGEEIRHRLKAQGPFAEVPATGDLRLKLMFRAKVDGFADANFPARPDEGLPFPWSCLANQKNFHLSAKKLPGSRISVTDRLGMEAGTASEKPSGKDAAIVKNY